MLPDGYNIYKYVEKCVGGGWGEGRRFTHGQVQIHVSRLYVSDRVPNAGTYFMLNRALLLIQTLGMTETCVKITNKFTLVYSFF